MYTYTTITISISLIFVINNPITTVTCLKSTLPSHTLSSHVISPLSTTSTTSTSLNNDLGEGYGGKIGVMIGEGVRERIGREGEEGEGRKCR